MKKILFVVLSIIWLGCVTYRLIDDTAETRESLEYTIFNDDTFVNDDVYITENTGESGYLYRIGSDYHVKNIFRTDDVVKDTWLEQVVYFQNTIYLLVMGETTENGQDVSVFNILTLDPNTLKATGCTRWMKPYIQGSVSDMTVDGDYIYLTMLMENKSKAGVYALSLNNFSPIEELDKLNIRNVSTIRYSDFTEATDGYYYVYANYSRGNMTTLENGSGLLLTTCYNEKAAEIYDSKIFTPNQFLYMNKSLVIQRIFIFIAGELLIAAVLIFFHRRNRVGYLIIIWELMLCVVIYIGADYLKFITSKQNKEQGVKFASYAMEDLRSDLNDIQYAYENSDDFYNSSTYRSLVNSLEEMNYSYNDGNTFLNILVVDTATDMIIAAAEGFDRCSFEKIYGSEASDGAIRTTEYGMAMNTETILDGRSSYFVYLGDVDATHPSTVVVGVFDVSSISAQLDLEYFMTLIGIGLFIIASFMGSAVLLLQSFDLHRIGDSMEAVADEKRIRKPRYLGSDVGDMWSGLLDIDRTFRNVKYKKYKLYEAYYRFAPKAVATLLGRDSVSEVNNGDSIKSSGTVASYRMDIKRILADTDNENIIRREIASGNIRKIMELINKYQEQGLALQVSSDSDMSDMKFIMPENNRQVIDFGVEFHKELQHSGVAHDGKAATIFMHYSDFIYGVAGTEEHAMQVMIAPDYIKLEPYLDILTELSLRLVVTGNVYDREKDVPANRFIGYFAVEGGESIPLFEIIEACPDEERRIKQESDVLFQKALKLFFENNFYLARNNFAHILKQNPQDTVARWYVFACEKYLESNASKICLGLNQKLDY